MSRRLASLIGAATLGLTLLGTTPAAAAPPDAGQILFEDDFNGAADAGYDPNKWTDWSTCTYDATAAFGGIACGDTETLDGQGHLRLPATAPTPQDADGTGAALRSDFTFDYGVITATMKMPAAAGSWGAFWTLNNAFTGGNPPPGKAVGEVDAVESYTTFQNEVIATAHSHTVAPGVTTHAPENHCPAARNMNITAWNDYSAKIEPDRITFYLNGVQCGDPWVKPTTAGAVWGFGADRVADNFLILQHAVGGAGGQNPATGPLGVVLVDRVEVRALPTPAQVIESGVPYRLENECGGKALDVPAASTQPAVQLITWTWNGQANQQWRPVDVGAGYWKLVNVHSGQAVNVAYSSTENGGQVIQYPDNGGPNQEWQINPVGNGYYQLINRNSGKALDVSGANPNNGGQLIQWAPNTVCSQRWKLVKV